MTNTEFTLQMMSLGCDKPEMRYIDRMLFRFIKNYNWLTIDELYNVALWSYPKARRTYDAKRGAAFASHLATVTCNDIKTYIGSEQRSRAKFVDLADADESIPQPAASGSVEQATDQLRKLSKLLSPGALAVLKVTMLDYPAEQSLNGLSRRLGYSTRSIALLQKEIAYVGTFLKGTSDK